MLVSLAKYSSFYIKYSVAKYSVYIISVYKNFVLIILYGISFDKYCVWY